MTISFRLSADEVARLEALVQRIGRSRVFMCAALHEYLENLKDAFAADEAYADYIASVRRSRPWTELKAELGL